MDISTNNYDIIGSGQVIVPPGEYVEFKIESLRFRFYFEDTVDSDSSQSESSISGTLVQDDQSKYLSIKVVNYRNLFQTTNKTIEVGRIKGKALSVMFSIVSVGSDNDITKIFYYTWYKAKQ